MPAISIPGQRLFDTTRGTIAVPAPWNSPYSSLYAFVACSFACLFPSDLVFLFDQPLFLIPSITPRQCERSTVTVTVIGVCVMQVGHAGTLDPAATGLLIICTGRWA